MRLLLLVGVLIAAGCDRPPNADDAKPVVVFAAASTQGALDAVAAAFSARTGHEVVISSGASNLLAQQIIAGAPAEVFLSANPTWADELTSRGLSAERITLLTNRLVVITPADAPRDVVSLSDLNTADLKRVAIAGENVPAGVYATQALTREGVYQQLVDRGAIVRGQNVRTVLAYIQRGEADAGIVYATDASVTDDVTVVLQIPVHAHEPIEYPAVLIDNGDVREEARAFYAYLQSGEAADVFRKHGFQLAKDSE